MARYNATTAKAYESTGGSSFRIQNDGEKVRVVFLYDGPDSIDGWAVHRFFGKNYYTYTVDCARGPKDPIEKCPACAAGEQIQTRLFVRLLNLNTNEVTIWDRASSFRRELIGFMEYFNPLYGRVYEITRRGTGINTTYQFQSLGESGITEEQYKEYVEKANAAAEEYVRPPEAFAQAKSAQDNAQKEEEAEGVQVSGNAPAQGAWGAPPQGAWGAQAPSVPYPQPTAPSTGAPAQGQAPAPAQGGAWGQAPAGNWGTPPAGWGNPGNQ